MQIDLSKLFEREGSELNISCPFEAESISFGGETFEVVNKSEVELEIRHSHNRQISARGHVLLRLGMPCSRCLKMVEVPFELEPETEISMNHPADSEDEMPYVSGYSLDVDLFVLDELYVNMPMQVLCKEDCKGLCPKCGKDLNGGDCGCDKTVLDPRMAKILDIFNAEK